MKYIVHIFDILPKRRKNCFTIIHKEQERFLEGLPEETKSEAVIELLVSEAIKIGRTHSLKEAKK